MAAVSGLASVALAERNREAFADTVPWYEQYTWTGNVPAKPYAPGDKHYNPENPNLGQMDVVIPAGHTAIMVSSQYLYNGSDPFNNGEQLKVSGEENVATVTVMQGDNDKTVVRQFDYMAVNGNFLGIVHHDASYQEAWDAFIYHTEQLRDPKLNNCTPGVGCTGIINWVLLGYAGDPVLRAGTVIR